MEVILKITPSSLKDGTFTLPIDMCRNWDAIRSIKGKFIYAGVTSDITFSPAHLNYHTDPITASAWQIKINNSIQFAQLKQDAVYTYAHEKNKDECLICDYYMDENNVKTLKVVNTKLHERTPELNKLASLLKQGVRPEVTDELGSAPTWNAPSEWIDFNNINNYKNVKDCIYLWYGTKDNSDTTFLYVGIVGDTRTQGESKRTLTQRLKEEQKKYKKEYGVNISKFRYCSLNNANGMNIPNMLKTIEMAEITVLCSLFFCEKARANINPIFNDKKVILLNKMTSYKFVE